MSAGGREPKPLSAAQSQRISKYVEAYRRLLTQQGAVRDTDLAQMLAGDVFELPGGGPAHRGIFVDALRRIGANVKAEGLLEALEPQLRNVLREIERLRERASLLAEKVGKDRAMIPPPGVPDTDRYTFFTPLEMIEVAQTLDHAFTHPVSIEIALSRNSMGTEPRSLVEKLAADERVRAVTFTSSGAPARRGWDWPVDVAVYGSEAAPPWVMRAAYEYLRHITGFRAATLIELALLPMDLSSALKVEVPMPVGPIHTIVIMAGIASTEADLRDLDALRSRWGADAAVAPGLLPESWERWMGALTRELAHIQPLDAAVFAACSEVKAPRPLCVGKKNAFANAHLREHAKRALPKLQHVPDAAELLDDINIGAPAFEHEDMGARRMAKISQSAPPFTPRLRHVFADLYRNEQRVERGTASELHELWVQIREPGPGVMADEPVKEPADWVGGETHELDVVLQELRGGAKAYVESLTLPPQKPSSIAKFKLMLPDLPEFCAQIKLIEKPARILQVLQYRLPMGAVQSPGLEKPELTAEIAVRDLGGPRSSIPVSAVVGNSYGEKVLSLLRDGEGIAVPLSSFDALVKNVSDALNEFADGQKTGRGLGNGQSLDLLRNLADEGVQLREALAAQWGSALEQARHIQLISADVNKLLPLEVCYDGPSPRGAKLCKQALPRLVQGQRACTCDPSSTDVICPLRFWGLSRIIERHGPDPSRNAALGDRIIAIVRSIGPNETLNLKGRVLWAMDSVVDSDGAGGTLEECERHATALKDVLQADFVKVDCWRQWEESVKMPTRIIAAVVHNDDETTGAKGLYLNKKLRPLGQVDSTLVGSDSPLPVVVLLGCKTLGPSATSFQPAFRFKIKSVPAVIATQAPVIGRFAADCAHELVVMFREQSDAANAEPMGEVLRRARCRLLAKGLTTALAIVALGDADQLVGREA